MHDDDRPRCEAEMHGMQCTLPVHGGETPHRIIFTAGLPADLQQVLSSTMDQLDEQRERLRRARRFMYVAAGLNTGALLFSLWSLLIR